MADHKTLCVYCAASDRVDEGYRVLAHTLGSEAARRGIRLVFGAGNIGLMGALAKGALAQNGHVTGIIPEHLERRELGHKGISEYIVVDSMHSRKRAMFDRSDAFAILPGGLGTLDEAFEVITWRQLGLHEKPIFLVNGNGFWDPLLALVRHLRTEGFLHQQPESLFKVVNGVEELLEDVSRAPRPAASAPSDRL